jgi:hypothetical protein
LERRLTAPAAADLHGVSLAQGRLAAASTGGDCIVVWDLESGNSRAIGVGKAPVPATDIRFPERADRRSGNARWRTRLPGRRHINGVALTTSGFVSCMLTRVIELAGDTESVLHADDDARFHDLRLIDEHTLLITDSARGEILFLDLRTRSFARARIMDPTRWFLRGLEVVNGLAYVLGSNLLENRQDTIGRRGPVMRRGASLGLSVVDLDTRRLVTESTITVSDAPVGSVAYQAVASPKAPGRLSSR